MAKARGCGISRCVSTALLLQYAAALTVLRDAPLKAKPYSATKKTDAPPKFNADLSLKEATNATLGLKPDSAPKKKIKSDVSAKVASKIKINPDLSVKGAPKPRGFVDQNGIITSASTTTNATCTALQSRISADMKQSKNLKDISCKLLEGSRLQSQGCECRLLARPIGGACPYDCRVPGCVNGAAKELGLKSLTSGTPFTVQTQRGMPSSEAFTCTYWQEQSAMDVVYESTKEAEAEAARNGQLKFWKLMGRIEPKAEHKVTAKVDKTIAADQQAIKSSGIKSLKFTFPTAVKSWAAKGYHPPNEVAIWKKYVGDTDFVSDTTRLLDRAKVAR